eukprot:4310386-Pyramimonas_sp.AAC.2
MQALLEPLDKVPPVVGRGALIQQRAVTGQYCDLSGCASPLPMAIIVLCVARHRHVRVFDVYIKRPTRWQEEQ